LLRNVVCQRDKVLALGHRRTLAAQLDDRGDAAGRIDIHAHAAFGGLVHRPLVADALVADAQNIDGLLHFAARLLKR
jgi:hypothetical protein